MFKKALFSKVIHGAAGLLRASFRRAESHRTAAARVQRGFAVIYRLSRGEGLGLGWFEGVLKVAGARAPGPAPSPGLSPSDHSDLRGKHSENPWHRRLIEAYVGSAGS